ncbi:MAG: hypothetical protein ACXABY_12975, partial [Candidatus Thorarchaeota archaeon]
ITSIDRSIYWLGEDGLYRYDGQVIQEISKAVRSEFNSSADPEFYYRAHAYHDVERNLFICWYVSINSSDGYPDRAIVFNINDGTISFWGDLQGNINNITAATSDYRYMLEKTWRDVEGAWLEQSGSWFSQTWGSEAPILMVAGNLTAPGNRVMQVDPYLTDNGIAYEASLRTHMLAVKTDTEDSIVRLTRAALYSARNGVTLQIRHGRSDDGDTIIWHDFKSIVLSADEDHFVDFHRRGRFHMLDFVSEEAEDIQIAGIGLEIGS